VRPSRAAAVKDGPTWGPPGGLVLDGREHDGRLVCVGIGRVTLVVIRGEIPDRGMTTARVVEALDEFEHRDPRLGLTIPIVFGFDADPIETGLVSSLDHPGGNITGITSMTVDIGSKRLGLLRDLLPRATPVAVLVEQGDRVRRIGVLEPGVENDSGGKAQLSGFTQRLGELGWADGRNLRIDFRWAAGNADWIRMFAKELVGLRPDVILARASS
jgi:ABC transporter substrate binding protein